MYLHAHFCYFHAFRFAVITKIPTREELKKRFSGSLSNYTIYCFKIYFYAYLKGN